MGVGQNFDGKIVVSQRDDPGIKTYVYPRGVNKRVQKNIDVSPRRKSIGVESSSGAKMGIMWHDYRLFAVLSRERGGRQSQKGKKHTLLWNFLSSTLLISVKKIRDRRPID